jgi:hypothetical protein
MLSIAFFYSAMAHGVEAVMLVLLGAVLLGGILKRVWAWGHHGPRRAPPQALYGSMGVSSHSTIPGPPANP